MPTATNNAIQQYVCHNQYYKVTQGVGVPIVLLHGWGGSSASFVRLEKELIHAGKTVITVDFAGFGDNPIPPSHWGIFEYADSIKAILDRLGNSQYDVVGHSFGGRVGIILGSHSKVRRLVLCAAAGIKPKRSLKYYYKVYSYKLKRKLGCSIGKSGSNDYQALSDSMKEVFVRIVNQHLEAQIKEITASTLIIWGKDDKTTPVYMAKKLHKSIVGSGLIIMPDCGHYCYMEQGSKFALIIKEFFKD